MTVTPAIDAGLFSLETAQGGDALQGRLFSMPEDFQEEQERQGIYDASRLATRRPDAYQAIVAMLGQGAGLRAIKNVVKVHHYTIAAVAQRERIAIDTRKERVCADLRLAQRLLAESIVEDVIDGRLKPEAKAVTLGIITDKLELLTGGATVRIETSAPPDRPRTWREFQERMRERMGLEVEGNGEMGRVVEAEVRVHRLGVGADKESPDYQSIPEGSALSGARQDPETGGGGGFEEAAGLPSPSMR